MRRHIAMDRAHLVLPDGRQAESLRLLPLRKELERLNIPGLVATDGKQELLNKYEAALLARLEAISRNTTVKLRAGNTATEPSPTAWRSAAEAMQEAAR